jgi:2,5-dihydroxypyridine 5,6-dioxygenase
MKARTENPRTIEIFRNELELCGIGRGQSVAVLSEGEQLRDHAINFLIAARELGADAEDVNLPSDAGVDPTDRLQAVGQNSLSSHPDALQACMSADLVIDHLLLLFSKEQRVMQNAGARVLMVVEPVEVLQRLFPTQDLRLRVEAAERRLRRARELRFTNRLGTDVTYQLGKKPVIGEYGFTQTPGRWDHWPSGFLIALANDAGVNGRVVMAPDDILYPHKKFAQDPIEFVIRDGQVVEIRGSGSAEELRNYMASYNDARAYAVSHIGWGLNEQCIWTVDRPGIGMDGRAYYGNVLFSLGPDTEFGGSNDTVCHLDLPMKNCTLYLDDEPIIDGGRVVPDDMRVDDWRGS